MKNTYEINLQEQKFFPYIFRNWLNKLVSQTKKIRTIDLGCGDGFAVAEMRKAGLDTIGVDLFNSAADIKIDLSKPFDVPGTFDLIYCNHVVRSLPNRAFFWRFVNNKINNNGIFVLVTPIDKRMPLEELHNELQNFELIEKHEFNPIPFLWRFTNLAFRLS